MMGLSAFRTPWRWQRRLRACARAHLTLAFLLLSCVLAACGPAPLAADASGNLIANGGFEAGGEPSPSGWSRDPQSAGKGDIALARENATSGSYALKLVPNEKNVDAEKFSSPLALGQGFDARPLNGKTLRLAGSIAATGAATAVLAVYVHRADGQVIGTRLTRSAKEGAASEQHGELIVPDDGKNKYVVLICAVEGQSGAAYFDDVRLTLASAQPAVRSPSEGPGPDLQAEVDIDAAKVLRSIPKTLYGTNLEWIWDGNGIVRGAAAGFDAQAVRLSRALGVTLLRFPGGVFSDFYDWKNGTGAPAGRPETPHMPGAGSSRHTFGTDEALQLSRELGAPLLITANIATGKPEDAVAWMRYVEQQAARDPAIPAVRFWEIGNENYNNGNLPYLSQSTLTPEAYATRYLQFAKALRAANPRARLIAISDANFGSVYKPSYPDWDRKVLPIVGRDADYIAVHNAYSPTFAVDRGEDLRTLYGAMLASPHLVRRSLEQLTERIRAAAPDRADEIGIAVTEWGPAFQITPQGRYVDHVKTLGSALYVASVMKVFIETPKVQIANFFKLTDPLWSGWIGKRGGGFVATAPYYAFQMYTRHFGDRLVAAQTRSPAFSSRAAGMVDALEQVPYLEVVASTGSDGKSLHLIGINKHFDRAIRARIRIEGFTPSGAGRAWTLSGTSIDAHTGSDVFRAPGVKWARQATDAKAGRFDQGGPDEVQVREAGTPAWGTSFEYVFPARSVTAMVLPGGR
jgi:alpha-N-arabinofuranosidase